jgi:fructose-bisphosphate aldolase class II
MGLVTTSSIVADAVAGGRAAMAFNIVTLEHVEAVVGGAEDTGRPVILQVSQNAVAFHGGRLRPLAAAAAARAAEAQVPVSLHLDHVSDLDLLHQAARGGFSSVMVDAGALPYADNVATTRTAVEWAHGEGLWVEAELGHVGGKEGPAESAHTAGVRTDPEQAAEFVAATGVDALAVAVGSSHAMRERRAQLDHELVARLRRRTPVPLVLHGSSGVPEAALRAAVAHGITKVNVGTALGIAYTGAVRECLLAGPDVVDPRTYLRAARTAMRSVVAAAITSVQPVPVRADRTTTTRDRSAAP